MASVGTSWKVGLGVITGRTAASGTFGNVKYNWLVTWLMGGEGQESDGPTKPTRPFDDSEVIDTAANVGHPCMVTVDPSGTLRLFVYTEVWGVNDC